MKILRISTLVDFLENSILILLIAFTFYISLPIKTTKTLFVPKGSIHTIISKLHKQGYDLSFIDKYILSFMGIPKTGWIALGSQKMHRIDFLYKLTSAKAMIHKVTLIPGETKEIFLATLASQLDLNKTKLHKAYDYYAHYPEAGIYADTYHVPYGIGEKHLLSFLTKLSNEKYRLISEKVYGTYSEIKWLKILTIASIVQKEAANNKEMPLVASVIVNRLKKGMRLQMDGTLNYGIYSHIKVTPERIKSDLTTFNTYKHKGLPSSPIGAVSMAAIKAAMKPASTPYLYFMKNKQGVHDFSKSYKEHRKNITKSKH
jgi:UPF0755 protein